MKFIFTLNLFFLSLDHITTGILGVFFPKQGIKLYKKIFGANIPDWPDSYLLFKPWGALAIFAALVTAFPIYDPYRYKGVLAALIVLLLVRILIRFSLHGSDYLGITKKRNLVHIALIAVCAIIISLQLVIISF